MHPNRSQRSSALRRGLPVVAVVLAAAFGLSAAIAPAQEPDPTASAASADSAVPESQAHEFDFWLGSWSVDLRARQQNGSWQPLTTAEAHIHPVLDGKAVLELWDSEQLKGFSLRYFDLGLGKWVLWLNWPQPNQSTGGALTGSFRHGRGEFEARRERDDGSTLISRYTFSDIAADRLRWDDAYSIDGGATWRHNWIMEFTRTAEAAPPLPPEGGPVHTYDTGERCDLPQFRRFEALAGHRTGVMKRRMPTGDWLEVPATLTGYQLLDGCAVLSLLRYEPPAETAAGPDDPAPSDLPGGEVLFFHTWNTTRQRFEQDSLDSLPPSQLEVAYGPGADDPEPSETGPIELTGAPSPVPGASEANDEGIEAPSPSYRWHLDGDEIRMELLVGGGGSGEEGGVVQAVAVFPGGAGP